MTVQKILNNNLILATDETGREQIVMGKGLRFFCQVGQALPAEHVQKVFVLQDDAARRYMQLLQEVPAETAEALGIDTSVFDSMGEVAAVTTTEE